MVINEATLRKVLGSRYNPLARYSVYGTQVRGRGPSGHKVGEIVTSNDTLSIYESLPPATPEAPAASPTKEPTTRGRRQPVRR